MAEQKTGPTPQDYLDAIGWKGSEQDFYRSRGLMPGEGGGDNRQAIAQALMAQQQQGATPAPTPAAAPVSPTMGPLAGTTFTPGAYGFIGADGVFRRTPYPIFDVPFGAGSDWLYNPGGGSGSAAGTGGPGADTG